MSGADELCEAAARLGAQRAVLSAQIALLDGEAVRVANTRRMAPVVFPLTGGCEQSSDTEPRFEVDRRWYEGLFKGPSLEYMHPGAISVMVRESVLAVLAPDLVLWLPVEPAPLILAVARSINGVSA